MNTVREIRAASGLTQQQLADAASTSQPTIAAYESGSKSPTLRTLQRLADAAGAELSVRVVPQMTREERRSLALHAAIAEQLRAEPEVVLERARTVLRRMRMLHPHARALLDEWQLILRRPVSAVLPVLTDVDQWSRELRHVTPFAGVLSAADRARVYREFAHTERSMSTSGRSA